MKTEKEVDILVKLLIQLADLCGRTADLANKRPNDAINKFKLKIVNDVLGSCNATLPAEYRPNVEFSVFEEASLPTNSDVLMMLSQYLACLRKFARDNTQYYEYNLHWVVNGKIGPKVEDDSLIKEEK